MQITLERLRELIDTLRTGQVGEFEYEDETIRLKFVLAGQTIVHAAAPAPVAPSVPTTTAPARSEPAPEQDVVFVTSPFVGTFYRSSSPDAAPFVDVGARISVGQPLCIVEAMKLMNEIESEISGTVLEVLIDNGVSVEFGQKLFKVKKS
ncbi:MAG TPA: acetyl-CoA carboxylase biotin carboxyl carrier protein [Polyangiaceae bacterium]|nr:acetyl-CoA carboxylase biotin carboxyl carrier protein [Polyangiaceae bacterium]